MSQVKWWNSSPHLISLALLAFIIASGIWYWMVFKSKQQHQEGTSLVDSKEIRTVLPKDAIPAIRSPKFIRQEESTAQDSDRVLSITIGEESKAYPIDILNWHEIVNDEIGGRKVAVTYCPLCGTGLAFDRVLEGQEYIFGVSGKLYMNNLVMYDEQTESLWSQAAGHAIQGALSGKKLIQIPIDHTTFGAWKEKHPDGLVLSQDTGYNRDYDSDPYLGYAKSGEIGIFGQTEYDKRLDAKTLVFGLVIEGVAKAYPLIRLPAEGVVNDDIASKPIVIFNSNSKSFQSAFSREFQGQILEFDVGTESLTLKDKQTGTTFSAETGESLEGKFKGKKLEKLPGVQAFWFAWADFYKKTDVYGM